jgi:hypothetical protein
MLALERATVGEADIRGVLRRSGAGGASPSASPCLRAPRASLVAGARCPALQLREPFWRSHVVAVFEDAGEFFPVDVLHVEADADPSLVPDVRRLEEPLGVTHTEQCALP